MAYVYNETRHQCRLSLAHHNSPSLYTWLCCAYTNLIISISRVHHIMKSLCSRIGNGLVWVAYNDFRELLFDFFCFFMFRLLLSCKDDSLRGKTKLWTRENVCVKIIWESVCDMQQGIYVFLHRCNGIGLHANSLRPLPLQLWETTVFLFLQCPGNISSVEKMKMVEWINWFLTQQFWLSDIVPYSKRLNTHLYRLDIWSTLKFLWKDDGEGTPLSLYIRKESHAFNCIHPEKKKNIERRGRSMRTGIKETLSTSHIYIETMSR